MKPGVGNLLGVVRGTLRPVGQEVRLSGDPQPVPAFPEYGTFWTASGTTGLALAVLAAMRCVPVRSTAKVLLPAYGCPNLAAAVIRAGAVPVLIDTRPDDPSFDMDTLARRLDPDVVAVVAVNFLGIGERHTALRSLLQSHGAWLIEDRAQAFPAAESMLAGEAVVLSFGRGKPVNLLGGGAVLFRDDVINKSEDALTQFDQWRIAVRRSGIAAQAGFRLRAMLFNIMSRPQPYGLMCRIPGLGVGVTRYRRLHTLDTLDACRLSLLGANADAWLRRDLWRERAWDCKLASIEGVECLPVRFADRVQRLLRYPVLLPDRSRRNAALRRLTRHGLGASAFYGEPLPEVANVPPEVARQGPFPMARSFADRLLLLPLHDGVLETHIEVSARILAEAMAAAPA